MPSLHLACDELTAPVRYPYLLFREASSVRRQAAAMLLMYGFTCAVASMILFNSAQ